MNIQRFFEKKIEIPEWIIALDGNPAIVVAYCVNKFIGKEFSKKDLPSYMKGVDSTPGQLMEYFESLGLKVETPSIISHKIIIDNFEKSKFTFITFKNSENDKIHLSFIKKYISELDKLVLFEDWMFKPFDIRKVELLHVFTAQVLH